MQTKHAYKIYEALMMINAGNQQSINAAENLVGTANTTLQYQKNAQGLKNV